MPQQTNLNVAPYFDDFDPANDYHKVLFKPGYPVQARELTSLQSILQNQIEKFGQHFFKEGAKVIPGNTSYSRLYYAIQLDNNFQGVPVSAYVDQLIGSTITGVRSGVTAVVDSVILPEDSENGNITLYVNYLGSSTTNNQTQTFFDAETLTCNEIIISGLLGNTNIPVGSAFASTIANNAAATGSAFSVDNGVYFIRGNFVNVSRETLILDQYGNTPSYRIGFFIDEEIVTADLDETLNDNSQGFNNYAAPGADRLQISVSLFKKPVDDFNDDNFILLATVINGVLQTDTKKSLFGGDSGYNNVLDTLARRTFDESGHYYVKPFDISVVNSLNNQVGNNGIFNVGQFTPGGATPNDNLALLRVSPGKAYVKGYECETLNTIFIDIDKPRTTKTIENQGFNYNTGPTFKLNSVYRAPTVGLGNTFVVSLRDQRVGVNSETAPGKEIGLARVYDFRLESGTYSATNANANQWDLSLYDVKTTTEIALNQAHTLSVPTFVKGNSSGATGFVRYAVNAGTAVTVYDSKGTFIVNEKLSFNGIENGRIAIAVTENKISNVKSVFASSNTLDLADGITGINSFSANIIQSNKFTVGIATISPKSGGVSTITAAGNNLFPGTVVKENDLIRYTDTTAGLTEDPIIARVTNVGVSQVTIEGVASVAGIASGFLPASTLSVTDLQVLTTELAPSSDSTLFTPLPKPNVAGIDLAETAFTIRKSISVDISSNQLSVAAAAGTNETFLPFDDERYTLIRSDGVTEELSADKFEIAGDAKSLQIRNLGTDNTGATLTATLRKVNSTSKVKIKNKVKSIIVDKSRIEGSGIGTTTLNNGLTYGNYPYGTRVEDELISLNSPDIISIHGIYESADISGASAPKVSLLNIISPSTTTSDMLIGETVTGETSGAVAIVAEIVDASTISYIYKNESVFLEGETLTFAESDITARVSVLTTPSFNISSNYSFRTGQDETLYSYGSIRRKAKSSAPSKQLKIYFTSASFDSTDNGDIITVESYKNFDYSTEIKTVSEFRNTDIIDLRPRVSEYTVTEGARSPLEFAGRVFNGAGQSVNSILASDESIIADVDYYLGRIDRLFLSKDGRFQVIYGTPSETPVQPNPVDDAIEICTIELPPYLFDVGDAKLAFTQHKRYRMQDIKKLEDRIRSLEYYTTLSLLEKETANLFIPDTEGLNRFKSGFFVDNFSGFQTQEDNSPINNSIDRKYSELRPRHYTNSVDMILGPVVDRDQNIDSSVAPIEGNNVRKSDDIVTLDYAEVEYIKQAFATRTESVTPFLISFWNGTMELTPSTDNWVDTSRLDAKIIQVEGNYAETLTQMSQSEGIDPQTGFGPILWDSWETNWGGITEETTTSTRTIQGGPGTIHRQGPGGRRRRRTETRTVTDSTIEDTFVTRSQSGVQSRNGTRTAIVEQFDQESVGDRVVSRDLIATMRSRNIEFVSKKMKPLTRMYAFFDGVDVTKYCVPKLLEISMTSGTFQVGETVEGVMLRTGLAEESNETSPRITFRVAQINHREGAYNSPTKTFRENPYNSRPLSNAYSSTSDILNVDTLSLSEQAQGEYFGFVQTGMTFVGKTSGAQATLNNVRLISDISATLIGSYFIPDPNNVNFPKFETGTKTFTLLNDEDNNQDLASTIAEENFTSSGTLEVLQENILSIRNARVEQKREFQERNVEQSLGTELVSSNVLSQNQRTQTIITWYDPLAQSFLVEDETGCFLTSIDVFFRTVDDGDVPVVFQLRSMDNGLPTTKVLPGSEIVLDPRDITTSSDGSVATNIQFKSPIYVEGGKEYAACLASNSTKYTVYISRIGENDLLTDTFISNQPYLGSLFKSQNNTTWEPSQWEDLKFTLYRADFVESGSVEFYSPELTQGNAQIAKLLPDPITLTSKKIRVGLGTTVADSGYEIGNTFYQDDTNATGDLVGTAGSVTGNLNVSNAGLGYTPADGSFTFAGVNLITITGSGRGATAEISINNGAVVASGVTITSGGSGYVVGDVLGITTIGNHAIGRDAKLTVTGIGHTNELILDNVQGNFVVGGGKSMNYFNSVGAAKTLNNDLPGAPGGDVQISSIISINDGLHMNINHQNHGMYFTGNSVKLSNVQSDIKPTTLTAAYPADSTSGITVGLGATFATFENVGVGTTNVGLIRIGEEIIEYTNVTGNTIGGNIVRGSNPKAYPAGTPVFKYELGGVSLNRINRTHDLSEVTDSDPFSFDSYKIKLDMSSTTGTARNTDVGFPQLQLGATKSTGGTKVRASQNMPFELMTPNVHNMTVPGTTITGEVRTITSRSFSGTETPYVNAGFSDIVINQKNYFDTPRMIASKVNEDNNLSTLPGSKSMNMRLFLNTVDPRLSPVIDTQRVSAVLTSNRVNNVITDYATDPRVDSIDEDPTACQYISKEIVLENSASSLKIILAAHVNIEADIRAFYSIANEPGIEPTFSPFPGYTNINSRGEVIAPQNNNGEPDTRIIKSTTLTQKSELVDYREYTFSIDDLPSFKTYRIKLNLTSNNQCFVPRIKDLRVIALA